MRFNSGQHKRDIQWWSHMQYTELLSLKTTWKCCCSCLIPIAGVGCHRNVKCTSKKDVWCRRQAAGNQDTQPERAEQQIIRHNAVIDITRHQSVTLQPDVCCCCSRLQQSMRTHTHTALHVLHWNNWINFGYLKCCNGSLDDSFILPLCLRSIHSDLSSDLFLLTLWFSQSVHVPLWPRAMQASKHVKMGSKLFKHKMLGAVKVHSSADLQHLLLVFVSIA